MQGHQKRTSKGRRKCMYSVIYHSLFANKCIVSTYSTVICNGDIREGESYQIKDILEKTLKRRRHVYSSFDAKTLSWAYSALKTIVEQRGLTTQLTRNSKSAYDFPDAWNQLLESKEPSQQPIEKTTSEDKCDSEDEEVVLSPFWSRFKWASLDTSRSMDTLSFERLKPSQLAYMAALSHVKKHVECKAETQTQPMLSNGDSILAKKTRRSADALIIEGANLITGKRSRSRSMQIGEIPLADLSSKRRRVEKPENVHE